MKKLILKTQIPESLYLLVEEKFTKNVIGTVSERQAATLWNDVLIAECFFYEHIYNKHNNKLTNIHNKVFRAVVGDSHRASILRKLFRDGVLHVNETYCNANSNRNFPKSYCFENSVAKAIEKNHDCSQYRNIFISVNQHQFSPLLKNQIQESNETSLTNKIFHLWDIKNDFCHFYTEVNKTSSSLDIIKNPLMSYKDVMKDRYHYLYYDVPLLLKDVNDDLYMCYLLERVMGRNNYDVKEKYGRLYYDCWHNLKSELRHAVCYDGEPLKELYDIKNCFWTLTAKLLLDRYPDVKEVKRFYNTVKERNLRRNCETNGIAA